MSPLRNVGAFAVTAGVILLVLSPRQRRAPGRFVSRRVVDRDERDSVAAEQASEAEWESCGAALREVRTELVVTLDEGRHHRS